jgi:hypothetical protein
MYYLVILVVDNPDDCGELLRAWDEKAGVQGATILESTGLQRVKQTWRRDDLPIFPSLREIFQAEEIRHRTIFTVIDDESQVDKLVEVSESILGSFDSENTGFLFVVPVLRAYGLSAHTDEAVQKTDPSSSISQPGA